MKMRIKYTAKAPISHIGEVASIGSYFNMIKTSNGNIPIVTGNSVRGILRDSGAKVLLDTLGTAVSKDTFHILFSGGNLNGTLKEDVEKAKNIRKHFPIVSLLGGGLGDQIMSGKIMVGNLYPLCEETYEMLDETFTDISWKNLISEIEFTRTDDSKSDVLSKYITDITKEKTAKASTQMRYSVQYMAVGTVFIQDIYVSETITDLELGALYSAFSQWFKTPILGGMANKGFGTFSAETDFGIEVNNGIVTINDEAKKYINEYLNFVVNEGTSFFELFEGKKK